MLLIYLIGVGLMAFALGVYRIKKDEFRWTEIVLTIFFGSLAWPLVLFYSLTMEAQSNDFRA